MSDGGRWGTTNEQVKVLGGDLLMAWGCVNNKIWKGWTRWTCRCSAAGIIPQVPHALRNRDHLQICVLFIRKLSIEDQAHET
jgi:hypothetical protein